MLCPRRPKSEEARCGLRFLRRDDTRADFSRALFRGASTCDARPQPKTHARGFLCALFLDSLVARDVDVEG